MNEIECPSFTFQFVYWWNPWDVNNLNHKKASQVSDVQLKVIQPENKDLVA